MKKKSGIIVAIIGAVAALLGGIFAALTAGGFDFLFPNRVIEFYIEDAKSLEPIVGAIIIIEDDTKRTGSDGKEVFDYLKKGYKKYTVAKTNYKVYHGTTNIKARYNSEHVKLIEVDPDPSIPRITFDTPVDEAHQFSPISLAGSSLNLPADKHFWIVVNPHGSNGWWPQDTEIAIRSNNRWTGSAHIGEPGKSIGQMFNVHFVAANQYAHKKFVEYIKKSERTGTYPEEKMPDGAESLGYITVIKK